MTDRRRHQRFVMADACEGTFQLLEDVTIQAVSGEEVHLLSMAPAKPGEVVSVEIPSDNGTGNAVFRGSVAESRPVMTDGALRHRVVVKVGGHETDRNESGSMAGSAPSDRARSIGIEEDE